jgi:hypothetical protein
MKILIFGRGMIAEKKYRKYLHSAYDREKRSSELELLFVDISKDDCFDVENWENEPKIPVKEIEKILIISTPTAHLSNFESIVKRFLSPALRFPDVYIEKPIYLQSQKDCWLKILKKDPVLEEKVFYIDHYRFKDSINFFLEEKRDILEALGPIREIAFVSLEKQAFWDSRAFGFGYFLEHGCHFFGMLDRVFPEIRSLEFAPFKKDDWRIWEQAGRPSKCKDDSAALLFLKINGLKEPRFLKFEKATIIVGKGMIDKKVFYIEGEKGFCQFFFNENKNIIRTSTIDKIVTRKDARDSYERVAENIFGLREAPVFLTNLEKGIADQESVIAIRRHFPEKIGRYNCGEIPDEIKKELMRMDVATLDVESGKFLHKGHKTEGRQHGKGI